MGNRKKKNKCSHFPIRFPGKYTCEITNAAGRASTSCQVDVAESEKVFRSYQKAKRLLDTSAPSPPEPPAAPTAPCFAPAPRDRRVEFGGSVQFMCRPVGSPPPVVRWYRQGEEMGDSGKKEKV